MNTLWKRERQEENYALRSTLAYVQTRLAAADRADGVVTLFLRAEGFREFFRDEFPADAGGEEFAPVGSLFLVDDDFDFALFLHFYAPFFMTK